ncbi:hypothetical protein [Kingella denitrificans]
MNDNEIKTMLARLQQDLSDPSAPMAEWTHAEFIPLDERKKNVKILNTGYWLGNAAMVAGSAYSCLTIFAGATFMQLVLIGLVSFLILASTFSWYKYVLPVVLKREYKLTQYKMDFKKEKLEIWQRGEKIAYKFHRANITLPPLPVPAGDKEQYRPLCQKLQQQIQYRTGFAFR